MIQRILRPSPNNSYFLFGARGTGKSTLLRQLFSPQSTCTIDLLDPATEDLYSRNPAELEHLCHGLASGTTTVIIDEIQKVPRLLNVVHRLIESTPLVFVMTGSSSRKLKRGASNLLAGRAFVHTLYPFSSTEIGTDFSLEQALQWGTLPKVHTLATDAERASYLRAYALTYLKEEIQAEQIVRKLDPFRHFLEVAAQSNGRIINYQKIADAVGVDAKTIITYFSILEETLIGIILPPFHRSLRKQQRTNPKFYFFDTGVKRALDRTLEVVLVEQTFAYGDSFEHFILIEILRLCSYRFPDYRFSYLQTAAGAEIDLVIDRPGLPDVLIEIKSTRTAGERDVATLQTFVPDFPECLPLCISRDPQRKKIGLVTCLHWRDALRELKLAE